MDSWSKDSNQCSALQRGSEISVIEGAAHGSYPASETNDIFLGWQQLGPCQ